MTDSVHLAEGRFSHRGILRRTSSGEWVIDSCATDAEHLVVPVDSTENRRTCQVSVGDFFASVAKLIEGDERLGGRVTITVEIDSK